MDLDQGGIPRNWFRNYLGPSIGWVPGPNNNILNVTVAGTYIIDLSIDTVLVNLAAPVTLILPSTLSSPAGATALPGTYVQADIAISDIGGFAGGANITIVPAAGDTIEGLSSAVIGIDYGSVRLKPESATRIWNLVYSAVGVISTFGFNVRDFGAVGNGVANDTVAIQNAINASSGVTLLWFTGGGTYIVDSLSLKNNLTLFGDGVTTVKLRNSATGGIFVWPAGTTNNVRIKGLILDGNFAGQPGAPHNLIHSIFIGDNTCTVTNSEFGDLTVLNADGLVFCGGTSLVQFTDCYLHDIRVTNFTQAAFAIATTRCLIEHLYLNNSSNTNVPFSGQGNAYGVGVTGIDTTIRDIRVALSLTPQTLAGGGTIGIALSAPSSSTGNNILDGCDVDCGGVNSSFAYTFDTGKGNKFINLTARNGAFNGDYEVFNQTNMQGANWYSIGDLASTVGVVFDGCTGCKLRNYNYQGITQLSDAVRFQSIVYGPNNDIQLDGYTIDTQGEALRWRNNAGDNFRIANGHVRNLALTGGNFGLFFDGGSIVSGVVVDGLTIDGCQTPWSLSNVQNSSFRNITVLNAASPQPIELANCANLHFDNIIGVNWARQSGSRAVSARFGNNQVTTYYSFPVQGGAIGTITFDPIIPAGAAITKAWFFTLVTPTSATNTAQISFGLTGTGGPFPTALANALNANANYIIGNSRAGNIDGTSIPLYFLSGDTPAQITMTITVQALTAGYIIIFVEYDQGVG
jgi:hypothetical protein